MTKIKLQVIGKGRVKSALCMSRKGAYLVLMVPSQQTRVTHAATTIATLAQSDKCNEIHMLQVTHPLCVIGCSLQARRT